jgi:hypothetical protein
MISLRPGRKLAQDGREILQPLGLEEGADEPIRRAQTRGSLSAPRKRAELRDECSAARLGLCQKPEPSALTVSPTLSRPPIFILPGTNLERRLAHRYVVFVASPATSSKKRLVDCQ